jgi:hypothetical protein
MNTHLIERYISEARFSKYKNLGEYEENLFFSKKSYIPLSILEVALRNAIDDLLTQKVGEQWHEDNSFLTRDSQFKVQQAKEMLRKRKESTSREKIIAELSFGFWVNLFKKPYDKKLRIKDLKNVFPNLPSKEEKLMNREVIYRELNHVRNFRNRIFHYEKVINKDNYNTVFSEIEEILNYFNTELNTFAQRLNNE